MAAHFEAEASKVLNGAWWTFASAMWLMLSAGTLYSFGLWSQSLKAAYNLDQEALEMLAVAGHLGNYIILDSGYLTSKYGTVVGLALGCSYTGVGYFCMWLSIAVFPGQAPFWALFAFCVLYGHGCGTLDNAVMTEILSDFTDFQGNACGCLKAYYALATATVTALYQAVFKPNETAFLLFIAIYCATAGIVLVPTIAHTKGLVDEAPHVVRGKFGALTAGLVVFAFYCALTQRAAATISQSWWLGILGTVVLGAGSLFLLPLWRTRAHRRGGKEVAMKLERPADSVPHEHAAPARDVSALGLLGHLDFYLFLVTAILGQGNGLMFVSNAGQILPAMEGRDMSETRPAFVASLAIFNGLARLAFGTASEALKGRVHRTYFFVAALCFMLAGYGAILAGGSALLWPGAALIGFGYGGLWGVQPPLVRELFGPSDYSIKYACSALAAAAGSLVFNGFLAGPLYERNAGGRPEFPACYDSSCYTATFAVAAALNALAIGAAAWLAVRSAWVFEEGQPRPLSDSEDSQGETEETTVE